MLEFILFVVCFVIAEGMRKKFTNVNDLLGSVEE